MFVEVKILTLFFKEIVIMQKNEKVKKRNMVLCMIWCIAMSLNFMTYIGAMMNPVIHVQVSFTISTILNVLFFFILLISYFAQRKK